MSKVSLSVLTFSKKHNLALVSVLCHCSADCDVNYYHVPVDLLELNLGKELSVGMVAELSTKVMALAVHSPDSQYVDVSEDLYKGVIKTHSENVLTFSDEESFIKRGNELIVADFHEKLSLSETVSIHPDELALMCKAAGFKALAVAGVVECCIQKGSFNTLKQLMGFVGKSYLDEATLVINAAGNAVVMGELDSDKYITDFTYESLVENGIVIPEEKVDVEMPSDRSWVEQVDDTMYMSAYGIHMCRSLVGQYVCGLLSLTELAISVWEHDVVLSTIDTDNEIVTMTPKHEFLECYATDFKLAEDC